MIVSRSLSRTLLDFIARLAFFTLILSRVNAQIPGTSICSCSPTMFNFTFSFASTCPGNIEMSDGIAALSCLVVSADPTDKVPVTISTMIILELNTDSVVSTATFQGPFEDGDTVEYVSISSYRNLTEAYFPFGLQVTMQGTNTAGDTVINTWAIKYTNNCEFEPVFDEDAQIGWTVFTGTEDPLPIYCPANDTPTIAPTMGTTTTTPTMGATTVAPTTRATTVAPTMGATTIAPTRRATTIAPTTAPSVAVTASPAISSTDAPTLAPTVTTTDSPTVSPAEEPVVDPTEGPTEAPVAVTDAPSEVPVVKTDAPTEVQMPSEPTPSEPTASEPTPSEPLPSAPDPSESETSAPTADAPSPVFTPNDPEPTPEPTPERTKPSDMSMVYSQFLTGHDYDWGARWGLPQ